VGDGDGDGDDDGDDDGGGDGDGDGHGDGHGDGDGDGDGDGGDVRSGGGHGCRNNCGGGACVNEEVDDDGLDEEDGPHVARGVARGVGDGTGGIDLERERERESDGERELLAAYLLPPSAIPLSDRIQHAVSSKEASKKAAWCFDIVWPHSRSSNCFTKVSGVFLFLRLVCMVDIYKKTIVLSYL